MSINFSGSVVIVTGAASGIGRQLALQAAYLGAHVISTDKNISALQETKELGINQNLDMDIHPLDVSDKKAIKTFADEMIANLHSRKLILINNAGVALISGNFQHTNLDDFEWLININLWGTINMTKAFYPYFLEQNRGSIVNISSVFGLAGVAEQSAYCTSKFGVRGFTETLRMELAETNIHTLSVHPGGIKTNIVRNAQPKGNFFTEAMHKESISSFDKVAKTSPKRAAELILRAIQKKKNRLLIGNDAKAIDLATRLFPISYTKVFRWIMYKTFKNNYEENK